MPSSPCHLPHAGPAHGGRYLFRAWPSPPRPSDRRLACPHRITRPPSYPPCRQSSPLLTGQATTRRWPMARRTGSMDPHTPARMESRARGGGVRPAGRSSNHERRDQPRLCGQDQCLRFLLWKELFELSMAGRLGVQGMEGRGKGGHHHRRCRQQAPTPSAGGTASMPSCPSQQQRVVCEGGGSAGWRADTDFPVSDGGAPAAVAAAHAHAPCPSCQSCGAPPTACGRPRRDGQLRVEGEGGRDTPQRTWWAGPAAPRPARVAVPTYPVAYRRHSPVPYCTVHW